MYTENLKRDVLLFIKAFLSNQLARFSPKLYISLTGETGRGEQQKHTHQIADYFIDCFHDYWAQLQLNDKQVKTYLKGKTILEYGPGDILGVALLMYAYGAETVHCIDQFPLSHMSDENVSVYIRLLDSLSNIERERAGHAFNEKGNPSSGFNPEIITYKITKKGLSDTSQLYDLIISRAVLEHVHNLEETLLDIKQCLKKNGLSIHKVDLKSHGLDRYTEFDFLTWPNIYYKLMYKHKGFPNRWRVNKYRELIDKSDLYLKNIYPTGQIEQEKVNIIYPKISEELNPISIEELSWKGFWMHLEHKGF